MSNLTEPKKALFYEKRIGTKGVKWGPAEKTQWFEQQTIKRSYAEEVLVKVEPLKDVHDVVQYGTHSLGYPLYCVRTKAWDNSKKTILVTGGVHGYETSGVQGAIRFVETKMSQYEQSFNFIVFVCICPWGYESINRWTPVCVDPNRSFAVPNTEENVNKVEETSLVMDFLENMQTSDPDRKIDFVMHMDLHETTDTDVTTFGPALAAREGIAVEETTIPDGFYLVGDSNRAFAEFEKYILDGVAAVTHLVPVSDTLLGEDCPQHAVVRAPGRELQLCMGLLPSPELYTVTTEVYPDSPKGITAEECTLAQVAAITSGLDYVIAHQ